VPLTQEEQVATPFSAYVAMGARFPDGPNDEYGQLCLSFLPHRRTEVAQLFSGDSTPEVRHIDSLAGGANSHPRLEAGNRVREIVIRRRSRPSYALTGSLASSGRSCLGTREPIFNICHNRVSSTRITNVFAPDSRQEPDEVILHVRICAGAAGNAGPFTAIRSWRRLGRNF